MQNLIKTSKTKIVIERFAFMILIVFGLIGALIAGIILHEYSHASDFNSVAKDEKICGLVLPNNIKDIRNSELGSYTFTYYSNPLNEQKVTEIKRYTELKAYSITFLVAALFFLCVVILVNKELMNWRRNRYLHILRYYQNRHSLNAQDLLENR